MNIEAPLEECLKEGGRYLLAVSGGADSMALLFAAASVSRNRQLTLQVAHVNHNLREASAEDARFVEAAAYELGLKFHCHVAADVPSSNIEAWGRRERYLYFNKIISEEKLDAVLTAHTANDVIETFLMRLISNKELRGIAASEKQRHLIRPFLSVWRRDIEGYLDQRGISFRDDASNGDIRFLRNRVRTLLIPFICENFEGDLKAIIHHQACAIDQDMKLLDACTHAAQEAVLRYPFGSRDWLRSLKSNIQELGPGLSWRLIDALFRPMVGFGLGREWSQRIAEFVCGNSPRMELPAKWVMVRKDGGLIISNTAACC